MSSLRKSQFKVNGRVQSPELPRKDLETLGCTSGCVSKDGGISEARTSSRGHSRVNEFVEKAMIASDCKDGEDGDAGDPPDSARSSEITGNPHDNATSSSADHSIIST